MKKAIITYLDGEMYKEIFEISKPSFEKYAMKCNAELVIATNKKSFENPIFGKFHAYQYIKDFDKSLFLDVDIIIQDKSPNIFDEFQNIEGVLGVDQKPYQGHMLSSQVFNDLTEIRESQNLKKMDTLYWVNTGVMLTSNKYFHVFEYPKYPVGDDFRLEQTLICARCHEYNCFKAIPVRWNCCKRMPCFNHEYKDSYFIHFNGYKNKNKIKNMRKLINNESFNYYDFINNNDRMRPLQIKM